MNQEREAQGACRRLVLRLRSIPGSVRRHQRGVRTRPPDLEEVSYAELARSEM